MEIDVRLFAQLADVLGKRSLTMRLPEGATAADVVRALAQQPGWERVAAVPLTLAVNLSVVDGGHVLADGDTVAVLTPVSGG